MAALADALADAGGARAPRERAARLRALLEQENARGAQELASNRSGYPDPVVVGVGTATDLLIGVAPVSADLRADPDAVPERAWLLVAALVGALVEAAGAATQPLKAGPLAGGLALAVPAPRGDGEVADLAALSFDEQVACVDRLRAHALVLPQHVVEDAVVALREPIGVRHPLRVAETVARVGGRPADPESVAEHEEAVLAALGAGGVPVRPHDDPDPARRVARRILQRLAGMGKWGGYHTEFAHLARGFAGNDRKLAERVGEELLEAGLLLEKPSVGQRHVFLNPRRAGDIYALIDEGRLPKGMKL